MKKSKACVGCSNAVYDDVWGEYKCLVFKTRVSAPNAENDCEEFKAGTPHETGRVGAYNDVKNKQAAEYEAGKEAGYEIGYSDGKVKGYESGKTDGRAEGLKEGYSDGYKVGNEAGIEEGYTRGFDIGEESQCEKILGGAW